MDQAIPPIFVSRKSKILADLATPDEEYTDASPKGSVDEGIRDLIEDINALPGLVTTSSCAGRISVFLEGRRENAAADSSEASEQRKFVPSGGKGAGKWLFVSHDPLDIGREVGGEGKRQMSLHEVFGMVPGDGKPPSLHTTQGHSQAPRLVRFHYEPMILHIMTANLHHAQPVLSAASSSGFRESGLQGLRCLEGDNGPSPIVAVRSAGLALESIIGYCEDNDSESEEPIIRSLVSEEYIQMLVNMSNERFTVNAERKERFRTAVMRNCSAENSSGTAKTKGKTKAGWENPEQRRERKRAEGLARKKMLESQATRTGHQDTEGEDQRVGGILHSLDT
ncbi:tRNA wybutosine-synthesizing 3 family protein [Aspergillus stella-maris]|uniref:tRNA wybutosine-synthesizing 3 family protein n=1 Tax=Aspergillus stella-maris TaxID=1810926 RepID=UPI003CCE044B